jgi:hypothetical protein
MGADRITCNGPLHGALRNGYRKDPRTGRGPTRGVGIPLRTCRDPSEQQSRGRQGSASYDPRHAGREAREDERGRASSPENARTSRCANPPSTAGGTTSFVTRRGRRQRLPWVRSDVGRYKLQQRGRAQAKQARELAKAAAAKERTANKVDKPSPAEMLKAAMERR